MPELPETPRGELIRSDEEIGEAGELPRHPIDLPLFFFLLTFAITLDIAGIVPIVGTILNFIIGPIIWLTYFFVGAKSLSATMKWLVAALMSSDFVLESFPFIQDLPINTVTAFLVYLLMHPRTAEFLEKAQGAFGRLIGYNKIAEAVGKVAKAVGKAV